MFTGIVQSVAVINKISDNNGIRTIVMQFEQGFCLDLEIGASVAVDGVCLTATKLISPELASFDVINTSLSITTLSELREGDRVNVERAAKEGAEIGGHPLSGHVDFKTTILSVKQPLDNYCIRFQLPQDWQRYIFAKGYIALNGASLTVSEVNKKQAWFEVWLIPETLRMTSFSDKTKGAHVNVEIERSTQVLVDTVHDAVNDYLGELKPIFDQLLAQNEQSIEQLAQSIQTSLNK